MWSLPVDFAPTRIRVPRGRYLVPWHYDARAVERLVELLRVGQEGLRNLVVLRGTGAGALDGRRVAGGTAIVLVRDDPGRQVRLVDEVEPADPEAAWARRIRVAVATGADWVFAQHPVPQRQGYGWLERHVKTAVHHLLCRSLADREHPLAGLGWERVPLDRAGELTDDPIELVDLVEAAVAHRIDNRLRLGEAEYRDSLRVAAARRLVERLRGIQDPLLRRAAIDEIVLRDSDASRPHAAGGAALQEAGLARYAEGEVMLGPLARAGREPDLLPLWIGGLERGEISDAALSIAGRPAPTERARAQSTGTVAPAPPGPLPFLSSAPLVEAAVRKTAPLAEPGRYALDALRALVVLPLSVPDLPDEIRRQVADALSRLRAAGESAGAADRPLVRALAAALRLFAARGSASIEEQAQAGTELDAALSGTKAAWARRLRADTRFAQGLALATRDRGPEDRTRAEALFAEAAKAWERDPATRLAAVQQALVVAERNGDLESASRWREAEAGIVASFEGDLEQESGGGAPVSRTAEDIASLALGLWRSAADLDTTERAFRDAVEAAPADAVLLGQFAVFLYWTRHDPNRAEIFFRRAVEADERSAANLGNYAVFLRDERRDHDQAEGYFRRAVEADPNHAIHLGNYANFLWKVRRDLDQAELHYRRALEVDPASASALGDYAVFLRRERMDFDQAEAYFRRAVDATPAHANNLGNYANFLWEVRRDLDQAELYYRRALEADPTHAVHLGNYALFVCDERKDLDQAEMYFRRAVEANPASANPQGNFARLQFLRGRAADGVRLLDRARALAEGNPALQVELAFYALAHVPDRRLAALAELRRLVLDGARSPGWDLRRNAAVAREAGHPDPDFLEAIARVVTDDADPRTLDAWSAWAAVPAEDEPKA